MQSNICQETIFRIERRSINSLRRGRTRLEVQMIIELKGVSKVYSTGPVKVTALQNIDLQVAPGEFVAIMGPSGSGKSTLMNTLGLLDRPTTGAFLFDGEEIG